MIYVSGTTSTYVEIFAMQYYLLQLLTDPKHIQCPLSHFVWSMKCDLYLTGLNNLWCYHVRWQMSLVSSTVRVYFRRVRILLDSTQSPKCMLIITLIFTAQSQYALLKDMERLVNYHLVYYLESSSLLNCRLYDFCKTRSMGPLMVFLL